MENKFSPTQKLCTEISEYASVLAEHVSQIGLVYGLYKQGDITQKRYHEISGGQAVGILILQDKIIKELSNLGKMLAKEMTTEIQKTENSGVTKH